MVRAVRAPRRWYRPAAVGVLLLLAAATLPGHGSARSPAPALSIEGTGPAVSWAYGATLEVPSHGSVGNVSVAYHDDANYAVVLNESNGVGGDLELSLTRLLGTYAIFTACLPNCTDPVESLRALSRGYEFETAVLTMTRNATVDVNGTARPALGLSNERLLLDGNLTISFLWQNFSDPDVPQAEWFNGTTAANTTAVFDARTPLGLVPTDPVPGLGWNASGSYDVSATTEYGGSLEYQGSDLNEGPTPFAGTVTPISPLAAALNGSDLGAPSDPLVANTSAIALVPSDPGTNLLEGALLVPSSAYLFASFQSGCDLAQRPCAAAAATPQLDYNASASDHLGWEAAVSSVSAFAGWFDNATVNDTPDGGPFWLPSSGLGAVPSGPSPGLPASAPTTIEGLPIPVAEAQDIQSAWLPTVTNSTYRVPPQPFVPVPPGSHGARGPGASIGNATNPLGGNPPAPAGGSVLPYAIVGIGAVAVVALLVAGRRRRPLRRPLPPPEEGEAEGGPAADDPDEPMGYVW